MTHTSLRAISGTALAVILVLVAVQTPVSGQGKARRIEGTWSVHGTARNCQTGAEIATFLGLSTFVTGGSIIATGAINPASLSTGHGVWEHAGGRSFTNTLVFFRFNPDGTFAGTQKVTRSIELGSGFDDFTSTNSVEIIDTAGNVIATRCSTEIGQRIE